MNKQHENIYEFGPFRIHTLKRLLLCEGEPVSLTSKCFDTLLLLIENRGEVVSKDALMTALWPDTAVEENNLTQQISSLRKALGERAGENRYVVTIPGRGYSFVAEVYEPVFGESDLILERHTRASITVDMNEEDSEEPLISEDKIKHLPPPAPAVHQKRSPSKAAIFTVSLILLSVAALTALLISSQKAKPPESTDARRSIAVLPFRTLNSDSADDYLSTGMTDTLIAKLSNLRQISVRPTSAIIKYAGQTPDVQSVGRSLGVDSVLEGTVQKSGDRIRVTVQLVSVQDKAPLWAQTFDEKMADIFTMQDTISEQVARAMQVKLSSDEQRQLVKRGTENVLAYQEYLRGRFFWNKRNEEGLRKCMEHFQQAINLDPNYAQAYVGLADSYAILAYYDGTVSKDDAFPKAKEAVLKALSIDEALSEAHASLALIKTYYDYDSVAAESEYRRAIEINPNYATAHQWYSDFLMSMGRMPESMSEITCAQELDPLSPIINTTLGERLFYMRRYDEAIAQLRYTLDIEPNFAPAHFALGLALEQKGSYVEAVAQMRKANGFAVSPGLQASLAHALAVMGQKSEANKILEELKKPQDCADPYSIAVAYMGLGDRQAAIDWLQKLKNKKGLFEMLLKIDPRLDGIRSDPKFQEIL